MYSGLFVQEDSNALDEACLTDVLDFMNKDNTLNLNLRMFFLWFHMLMSCIEEI